jgi:DNA-binding Lrp family transcriptional regulator
VANSPNIVGLDKVDRAIIRELQIDGRLSNQTLSERVGLSPSPCSRRLRLLEEAGIIKGYTALIDEAAIGFAMSVFVSIKLEKQVDDALNSFESAIRISRVRESLRGDLDAPRHSARAAADWPEGFVLCSLARNIQAGDHHATGQIGRLGFD